VEKSLTRAILRWYEKIKIVDKLGEEAGGLAKRFEKLMIHHVLTEKSKYAILIL